MTDEGAAPPVDDTWYQRTAQRFPGHEQVAYPFGLGPHEFTPGYSGMSCDEMYLDADGYGATCGHFGADPIHHDRHVAQRADGVWVAFVEPARPAVHPVDPETLDTIRTFAREVIPGEHFPRCNPRCDPATGVHYFRADNDLVGMLEGLLAEAGDAVPTWVLRDMLWVHETGLPPQDWAGQPDRPAGYSRSVRPDLVPPPRLRGLGSELWHRTLVALGLEERSPEAPGTVVDGDGKAPIRTEEP